jgi:hypothetical protein
MIIIFRISVDTDCSYLTLLGRVTLCPGIDISRCAQIGAPASSHWSGSSRGRVKSDETGTRGLKAMVKREDVIEMFSSVSESSERDHGFNLLALGHNFWD